MFELAVTARLLGALGAVSLVVSVVAVRWHARARRLTADALHDSETRLQSMVANMLAERRDVERMHDEFVSVVGHELRTPLTSMRAALQLVLAVKPAFQDPDHEPLLAVALKNCERLILSVNSILDVSRSGSGRMHPEAHALRRGSAGPQGDAYRLAGQSYAATRRRVPRSAP